MAFGIVAAMGGAVFAAASSRHHPRDGLRDLSRWPVLCRETIALLSQSHHDQLCRCRGNFGAADMMPWDGGLK
jgi:hypothetical protein